MKNNMSRRQFLKTGGLALAAMTFQPASVLSSSGTFSQRYVSLRPSASKRSFISKAVDAAIEEAKPKIKDEKLRWMFENCFPNTLDTTECILIDPYANAFNDGPLGSYWETDHTQHMAKELHERKWEIDSLCYPIRLAYHYWQYTEDTSVFDENWHKAMLLVVKTFKEQQRKQGLGPYSFTRDCDRPTDSQINNGWGAPVKPVGLIVSSFRPSDDATQYGFLIPSNMFAVVSLRQLAEIEDKVYGNKDFSGECITLADEVDAAIRRYGTFNHPVCGRIYAFEVDGFGNALCMDDANVPSLLAAPYLGYCSFKDAIYQNTRKMIWSGNNPYFFKGKAGEGVGGPHVGLNYIWPMSIIMKAFTTDDSEEIRACLKQLRDTDGGTGFMHESFHSEDAADFTRSWFAWTNTLFGELILNTIKEYPNLLSQIL